MLISVISNIAVKCVQKLEKWDYSGLCDYSKAESIVNGDNEYWSSIHSTVNLKMGSGARS